MNKNGIFRMKLFKNLRIFYLLLVFYQLYSKHFLTVLYVITNYVVNSLSKSPIKDGALSFVLSKYTKSIASCCFIWQKPALFIFTPETEYSYVCAICSRNLIR